MKTFVTPRFLGALAAVLIVMCVVGIAKAQTSPTRATACDPATPTNAICLTWTHDGKDTSGVALGKPVTFRVQQRIGTSGTYANIATGISALQLYVKNLAPGTYYFQVFANCSPDCTESVASNSANRDASNPVTQPSQPILTIAVVIGNGVTPTYRVLGKAGSYYPGEMFGLVPVGRECGAAVFKYRGLQFRRVSVNSSEVWPHGTSTANLAAPCAAAAT